VLVSCADTFSPYLRQMSMLLAHTLRKFPKEMFVRTLQLLGTAPEFLDANADVVERRVNDHCRSHVSPRAIGTQLRCLAASEMDLLHHRIAAPTLVVAGEYDPIIPSCYSRRMAEKIPGSEFFLARGAGHNPIVDHPHLVLPKVIQFLRDRDRYSAATGQFDSFVPYGDGNMPSLEQVQGGDGGG
jgi:pimeloyl-ACP methyl ester carboxylesterase